MKLKGEKGGKRGKGEEKKLHEKFRISQVFMIYSRFVECKPMMYTKAFL